MLPAVSLPDEWHSLNEAAGMSADGEIRKEVNDRLLCANKAGVPDAWPIDKEGAVWCRRVDGTIHELMVNDTNQYGSFSGALLRLIANGLWRI